MGTDLKSVPIPAEVQKNMELAHHNHVMYCLNIHPGEHWHENLKAISNYSLKVKEKICPQAPFALGLRLSAQACRELKPELDTFKAFLDQNSLYVVSLNGFPYGPFHGRRIKEKVYLPDWSSPLRVAYTRNLAEILACLLPDGEPGTISTVPVHYGKEKTPLAMSHLIEGVEFLARLEERTGKYIVLALEPEPDCFLDRLDSIREFFQQIYSASPLCLRYLGVCLDTCHAAVEFESPLLWLEKLRQDEIQVPKIQVSAALIAKNPQDPGRIFLPFSDEVYLHQTRVLVDEKYERYGKDGIDDGDDGDGKDGRDGINGGGSRSVASLGRGIGGTIARFKDLPEALASNLRGDWRVHFHVPLTWSGEELSSTARLIEEDFFRQSLLAGGTHFEVETYSFGVLPDPKPPVIDSLCMELEWLIKRLS